MIITKSSYPISNADRAAAWQAKMDARWQDEVDAINGIERPVISDTTGDLLTAALFCLVVTLGIAALWALSGQVAP